jgi:hypothetical protein
MKLMKSLLVAVLALIAGVATAQTPKKPSAPGKKPPQKAAQQYGCTSYMKAPAVTAAFDTSSGRGLADPYYLWDNGAVLRVKFLSGSSEMKFKVLSYAKEWEQFANVRFEFVENGDADIRVNLDNKGGHNSVIGQLATGVPQDVKTMNLDTTDFKTYESMHGTVMHEFGHALGLLHEHYSPLAGIPWNKELVYKELGQSQGWDKLTVDVNLFQQYSLTYTQGTSYDRKSIMHYPVLARWTTNGYSVPWNNYLSDGDKSLISALYPKGGARSTEKPRFFITDFTSMNFKESADKGGLLIYPSFRIKTQGAEGQVYFTVFFYDENGNPLMDNNDKYNISNVVATYKSFKFQAGKILTANKAAPDDFEMFIPYSELPVTPGTKIKMVFRAILVDGEELKWFYNSTPVNFSLKK